jgi:hypothetical protein
MIAPYWGWFLDDSKRWAKYWVQWIATLDEQMTVALAGRVYTWSGKSATHSASDAAQAVQKLRIAEMNAMNLKRNGTDTAQLKPVERSQPAERSRNCS